MCIGIITNDLLFRIAHHLNEIGETAIGIVRTGRRLGVVLNRHRALLGPHHAGARAVVEVDVTDLDARG